MTRTIDYLEMVREKLEIKSDYQLAKVLVINRGRISEMMQGKKHASPYICWKIADILEINRDYLLAEIEAERATTETQRNYWQSFVTRVEKQAANMRIIHIKLFRFFQSRRKRNK